MIHEERTKSSRYDESVEQQQKQHKRRQSSVQSMCGRLVREFFDAEYVARKQRTDIQGRRRTTELRVGQPE